MVHAVQHKPVSNNSFAGCILHAMQRHVACNMSCAVLWADVWSSHLQDFLNNLKREYGKLVTVLQAYALVATHVSTVYHVIMHGLLSSA